MRQKDRLDMLDTGVMPTADCNTDHRLVWTKVGLKIKPVRKIGAYMKTLDTNKLLATTIESEDKLQAK